MNKDFESYIMYNVKRLVNLAIKYINESEIESIKPKPKTITSFIRGSVQSPFFESFYCKHEDVCGKIPNIRLESIQITIDDLISEGLVKHIGDQCYINIESNEQYNLLSGIAPGSSTYPGRLQIRTKEKIGNTKLHLVRIRFIEVATLPDWCIKIIDPANLLRLVK